MLNSVSIATHITSTWILESRYLATKFERHNKDSDREMTRTKTVLLGHNHLKVNVDIYDNK